VQRHEVINLDGMIVHEHAGTHGYLSLFCRFQDPQRKPMTVSLRRHPRCSRLRGEFGAHEVLRRRAEPGLARH